MLYFVRLPLLLTACRQKDLVQGLFNIYFITFSLPETKKIKPNVAVLGKFKRLIFLPNIQQNYTIFQSLVEPKREKTCLRIVPACSATNVGYGLKIGYRNQR